MEMRCDNSAALTRQDAEILAIEALGFLAQNEKLLERFLSVSGLAAENLRQAALVPGFFAGILNFLLEHETDLLEFCAQNKHKPESIAHAAALPGGQISDC